MYEKLRSGFGQWQTSKSGKTIYVRGKAVTLIFWKKEKSLLIADVFMCWVLYKVLHFEGKEEKTLPCNNQVSNSPLKQVFGGLEYRKSGVRRRTFVY